VAVRVMVYSWVSESSHGKPVRIILSPSASRGGRSSARGSTGSNNFEGRQVARAIVAVGETGTVGCVVDQLVSEVEQLLIGFRRQTNVSRLVADRKDVQIKDHGGAYRLSVEKEVICSSYRPASRSDSSEG